VPQVIGGPPVRVRIQRLVRGGEAAGGDVGEEAGAGSVAQPVQRAARLAGGGDGLEHLCHLGRDVTGARG